tara:strand:- start:1909 stop:5625 length:3717 start_codon:yes stop_codon:yes gene_type:complete
MDISTIKHNSSRYIVKKRDEILSALIKDHFSDKSFLGKFRTEKIKLRLRPCGPSSYITLPRSNNFQTQDGKNLFIFPKSFLKSDKTYYSINLNGIDQSILYSDVYFFVNEGCFKLPKTDYNKKVLPEIFEAIFKKVLSNDEVLFLLSTESLESVNFPSFQDKLNNYFELEKISHQINKLAFLIGDQLNKVDIDNVWFNSATKFSKKSSFRHNNKEEYFGDIVFSFFILLKLINPKSSLFAFILSFLGKKADKNYFTFHAIKDEINKEQNLFVRDTATIFFELLINLRNSSEHLINKFSLLLINYLNIQFHEVLDLKISKLNNDDFLNLFAPVYYKFSKPRDPFLGLGSRRNSKIHDLSLAIIYEQLLRFTMLDNIDDIDSNNEFGKEKNILIAGPCFTIYKFLQHYIPNFKGNLIFINNIQSKLCFNLFQINKEINYEDSLINNNFPKFNLVITFSQYLKNRLLRYKVLDLNSDVKIVISQAGIIDFELNLVKNYLDLNKNNLSEIVQFEHNLIKDYSKAYIFKNDISNKIIVQKRSVLNSNVLPKLPEKIISVAHHSFESFDFDTAKDRDLLIKNNFSASNLISNKKYSNKDFHEFSIHVDLDKRGDLIFIPSEIFARLKVKAINSKIIAKGRYFSLEDITKLDLMIYLKNFDLGVVLNELGAIYNDEDVINSLDLIIILKSYSKHIKDDSYENYSKYNVETVYVFPPGNYINTIYPFTLLSSSSPILFKYGFQNKLVGLKSSNDKLNALRFGINKSDILNNVLKDYNILNLLINELNKPYVRNQLVDSFSGRINRVRIADTSQLLSLKIKNNFIENHLNLIKAQDLDQNNSDLSLKEALSSFFPFDSYALNYEFDDGDVADAVVKISDFKIPIIEFNLNIPSKSLKLFEDLLVDEINNAKKFIKNTKNETTSDYVYLYIANEIKYHEILSGKFNDIKIDIEKISNLTDSNNVRIVSLKNLVWQLRKNPFSLQLEKISKSLNSIENSVYKLDNVIIEKDIVKEFLVNQIHDAKSYFNWVDTHLKQVKNEDVEFDYSKVQTYFNKIKDKINLLPERFDDRVKTQQFSCVEVVELIKHHFNENEFSYPGVKFNYKMPENNSLFEKYYNSDNNNAYYIDLNHDNFKNYILHELIQNSLKHSWLSSEKNDRQVYFEFYFKDNIFNFVFWNNGEIIPKKYLDKIFDDGITVNEESKSGKGLFIMKNIVEDGLKGQLKCYNESGVSKFSFELPVKTRNINEKN